MWTRSWIYNSWNEKFIVGSRTRSLLYSTAELFRTDESNLAQLFKIPYTQIIQIFYSLSRDVHISYTDFNNMPWYEILMVIDSHNEYVEKQNDDTGDGDDMIADQQSRMESMYKQQQNSIPKMETPKMPDMSNFKF